MQAQYMALMTQAKPGSNRGKQSLKTASCTPQSYSEWARAFPLMATALLLPDRRTNGRATDSFRPARFGFRLFWQV